MRCRFVSLKTSAVQISMSGVQLMPGVLPYQENRGVLDSVTSKFSAFQVSSALNLHVVLEWLSFALPCISCQCSALTKRTH